MKKINWSQILLSIMIAFLAARILLILPYWATGLIFLFIGIILIFNSKQNLLISFIYICSINLFNFLPPKLGAYLVIKDIGLLLILIFLLKLFFMRQIERRYYIAILCFLCFLLIEAAVPYILLGQPYILGLFASRHMLYYLMFFIVIAYLKKTQHIECILNNFLYIALICSLISILQVIFWRKIQFVQYPLGMLNDMPRMCIGLSAVILSYFFILVKLVQKRIEMKNIIFLALLITAIILSQIRNFLFAITIVTIIFLLLKLNKRKLRLILIGAVMLGTVMYSLSISKKNNLLYNLVNTGMQDTIKCTNNIEWRYYTIEHYAKILVKNKLFFGVGSTNNKYMESIEFDRSKTGIHISDIGILGFLVRYGVNGAIILILYFTYSFFLIRTARKSSRFKSMNATISLYILYLVVNFLFTTAFLQPDGIVVLMTILALLIKGKEIADHERIKVEEI